MVTTKTTTHKFTTPGGNEIECTITRTYGNKRIEAHEETVWLDQPVPRPARGEFIDDYKIIVSINCEDKGEFIYRMKSGKVGGEDDNCLESYCGRQRIIIPLSGKDDEIIYGLIRERLNDDISPSDMEDIETVKSHIANNTILPLTELNARRKEYRDGMLEGGGGFNPYFYYISREFADKIIKRFPKYFK